MESVSLDDVIADIEDAWERGKLDLLMRHVRPDAQIQIYRDGDWVDSLTALVEHEDGRLEIVRWTAEDAAVAREREAAPRVSDVAGFPA